MIMSSLVRIEYFFSHKNTSLASLHFTGYYRAFNVMSTMDDAEKDGSPKFTDP